MSNSGADSLRQQVLNASGLSRHFDEAGHRLQILNQLNLEVDAGETLAIIGASGSGKSTLLHLLAGLDQPNAGSVKIEGEDLSGLSEQQRARIRNQKIGFVFQFHHLLPEFTALENVAVPMLIAGVNHPQARAQAQALLDRVGLLSRAGHRPAKLSGGERQRVAIARALANDPAFVLMDEPTGNLDPQTAAEVEAYLFELNRSVGTALIMVTHDHQLAGRMGRVLLLQEGELRSA